MTTEPTACPSPSWGETSARSDDRVGHVRAAQDRAAAPHPSSPSAQPPSPGGEGDLETVLADIRACRACLGQLPHTPRPVIHVFPETRLLICGQAPGRRVHESGLPFTDPSGDRLRDWLGVDYNIFYADRRIGVAAQAFCYPGTAPKGGDYPPPKRCAELWRPQLLAELPQVELTLLVGGYAQAWALGRRAKPNMTETVKAWREYAPLIVPLPHPSWRNTAWLKRNPWFEAEVIPYLRERVRGMLAS